MDSAAGSCCRGEEAGFLRGSLAAVENGEGAAAAAEAGEVAVELEEALFQGVFALRAPDRDLEGAPLEGAGAVGLAIGPLDEDVDAAAADAVFAIDGAASVDDALEEREEDELGGAGAREARGDLFGRDDARAPWGARSGLARCVRPLRSPARW